MRPSLPRPPGYDTAFGGSAVFTAPGSYGLSSELLDVSSGAWGDEFSALAWIKAAGAPDPSAVLLQVGGAGPPHAALEPLPLLPRGSIRRWLALRAGAPLRACALVNTGAARACRCCTPTTRAPGAPRPPGAWAALQTRPRGELPGVSAGAAQAGALRGPGVLGPRF